MAAVVVGACGGNLNPGDRESGLGGQKAHGRGVQGAGEGGVREETIALACLHQGTY